MSRCCKTLNPASRYPPTQVLELVRPLAAKQGLETPLELWGFFVKQCRSFLHIVLCMSPIGGAFRERLRQNPSIINCCTIDWWGEGRVGGGGWGGRRG